MSYRNSEMQYNPNTGKWEEVTCSGSQDNTDSSQYSGNQSKGSVSSCNPNSSNGANSKTDCKSKADKEYIEDEFNTLEGDLQLKVDDKTLSLKVGDTIELDGIGKYLSGLYYITGINRTLSSSDGYSHTLTVIKTGFGDSLKKAYDTKSESRVGEVHLSIPDFKVGDKVRFITVEAKKYVYSNASDGVYVPKWVTEKVHTVDAVSSDKQRVRLKEIWSWTYSKYLKKA